MNTAEQLTILSELGLFDQKTKDARERLKSVPKEAENAKLKAEQLQEAEKKLTNRHTELVAQRRKLDGEMQTEKSHLRKWEVRAEQIRGEREYAALMSEIGSQKRAISDIENRMLENMQMLEDLEKEMQKAKDQAEKAKSWAEAEWAKVKDNVAELEKEIGDLEQARGNLIKKLASNLMKRYEQIAKARGGQGVAFVRQEACQACLRLVPPELILRIMKGEVVEQCPSCQRILVTENFSERVVQN